MTEEPGALSFCRWDSATETGRSCGDDIACSLDTGPLMGVGKGETPGAVVGRAECMPMFEPKTKALDAAGVVSVVVWPAHDLKHPNAPVPDRALLRQVCTWLDARRLVTTELYVIPPTYRKIAVAVGLQAKPGYGIEAVRRWVELVLRQYLAPLPPSAPRAKAGPWAARSTGPELEAAALQVEGVLFIECLRLAQWDEAGSNGVRGRHERTTAAGCLPRERIALQPWGSPEVVEMTVVQGDALVPGAA
ncbi:baseplate J/gp47 family protein, partial [Caballeronia terrestris]|uniref:baseplate J/gp47 family protein n=1 Tax=Caballeronia terrestris TaxID=1226301 RepID=UPI00190E6C69